MVVPFMLSLIKFFLACSMPFLMAMGTSRALPMPKPAWPRLSPTTTSAEKLRFFPPLTTLVTRLMAMTSSLRSDGLTSRRRRTAKLSLKICFDIGLELYPRFPRRIRERLDAAVVLVPAAVEHYFADSSGLGALGNGFADDLGRGDVAAALEILFRFFVNRTGGNQCLAGAVVNDLRVDMAQRAIHAEARTLSGAGNLGAHAGVHSPAVQIARQFSNSYRCHC